MEFREQQMFVKLTIKLIEIKNALVPFKRKDKLIKGLVR